MIDLLMPTSPLDKPIPLNFLANKIREAALYSHKSMNGMGSGVSGLCNPPHEGGRHPFNVLTKETITK